MVRSEPAQPQGEDTLVLAALPVDISNQDTSEEFLDENVTETIGSSMVETAKYALKTGKVKQVVILENVHRYDVEVRNKDKKELAILANKDTPGLECNGSIRVTLLKASIVSCLKL